MYKETKMRMADFAPETVKARRVWSETFKILKKLRQTGFLPSEIILQD